MPCVSNTGHCLFMLVADYLRAFNTKLTLMLSTRASMSAKTFSIAASDESKLPSKGIVRTFKLAKN